MQCGGSDAFSGVTANPALGFASDLLVRAGATVMFSENTEVRDGVAQLTARAENADVAKALIAELGWFDRYLERGSVDAARTRRQETRGAAFERRREGDGFDCQVGHGAHFGRGAAG